MATEARAQKERSAPDAKESTEKKHEKKHEQKDRDENEKQSSGPDWLERIASWTSGALMLALAAFLVWDARKTDLPAAVEATAEAPRASGTRYLLPVLVRNTGDEPAQDVQVKIEIRDGDKVVADADLTIDWLAGRSKRHVVAVLPVNPATAKVSVEVTGFTEP